MDNLDEELEEADRRQRNWRRNGLTRAEWAQQIIDRGDLEEIRALLPRPCACMGKVNDEPHCRCVMTFEQVRSQVSLFALRRGKVVRLKKHLSPPE